MTVTAPFADWLRSSSLVATSAVSSPWGALAIDSSIISAIAATSDAEAEASRQQVFLGVSRVIDILRVPGRRVDLIGQAIALTADHEGYRAGATVFVISAQEQDGDNSTLLKVIRRLA